ncbi:MAG: UDP-3-O-[3-hydroxymyristoyl] N-acetylglucosamine deacetylase [uncultured bacterium]|nr:MAG: UDP-3-O-[3-hydroxymyristoyl] N-acetylglucosamine deacetylase [uncultured bacterium]
MTTILSENEINGICLMDGRECTVKITPSHRKGIYFYPDNSDIEVKACLDNVISTLHCTVLGRQDKQVRVVEHFMAACAFAGIDSLNVYMNSAELPILDGSALKWIEVFKKAGIQQKIDTQFISILEPINLTSSNAELVMLPSDNFKVSYYVNFDHPDLQEKWYTWDAAGDNNEIIEARTFGYLKDLEKFQQAGFALGVNIDNTIGLTETGFTTELRSIDEPIKHKILDLIGDLRLLEINPLHLKAHIVAREAGHKTHVEFAKVIQKYMEGKSCQQVKK